MGGRWGTVPSGQEEKGLRPVSLLELSQGSVSPLALQGRPAEAARAHGVSLAALTTDVGVLDRTREGRRERASLMS